MSGSGLGRVTAALEAWTSFLRFGADLFRQMRPRFALARETIRTLVGLNLPGELAVKQILKPVTYVLAALYFLVDAAFMAIAKPISDSGRTQNSAKRRHGWKPPRLGKLFAQ